MTWSKLSDDFFSNPKIVRAGRDARDLYLVALCHCNEHLTDGQVEKCYLRQLAAKADIDDVKGAVAVLVRERLWEETPGGYAVHDFLRYNMSRAEHETLHESRTEAGRRGGQRSGERRRGGRPDLREQNEANASTDALADAEASALAHPQAKTNPVSRIPYPESRSPEPNQPPSPPPDATGTSPPTGWEGGLDGWLSEINFLVTDRSQAEALLCQFGTEDVRWQVRALLWRQSQGRAIPQPWGYLVKVLRDKRPLPQAIALTRDGPKPSSQERGGPKKITQTAEKQTKETPEAAEARLAAFQRGAKAFAASRPKCLPEPTLPPDSIGRSAGESP